MVKEPTRINEKKIRSFTIEDPEWECLRHLSIIKKVTTSEILRDLIEKYIKENQITISAIKSITEL